MENSPGSSKTSPKHNTAPIQTSELEEAEEEFELIEGDLDEEFMSNDRSKYISQTGNDSELKTRVLDLLTDVRNTVTGVASAVTSTSFALGFGSRSANASTPATSLGARIFNMLPENDLLALLRQLPLRMLVKRLICVVRQDGIRIPSNHIESLIFPYSNP